MTKETSIGARFSTRQQVAAMRSLTARLGDGWAQDISRAAFLELFESELVARFGKA